ncbi:TVP38/TMEM64 family protein, partial [Bacillus sp. SIMBA_008]
MIKKGFSLAVIIAVVMIGFMQKDVWLSMIRAGGMYAVLMSI